MWSVSLGFSQTFPFDSNGSSRTKKDLSSAAKLEHESADNIIKHQNVNVHVPNRHKSEKQDQNVT